MSEAAQTNAAAVAIYQDLLDRIATSYSAGDFDAYARMIAVPHEVSSFGPIARIETRADLRRLFDDIVTFQNTKAVTDYIRTCLAARFVADDRIEGVHETRLLSGTQVIEQPYPVRSILRLIDGNWMVCSSDNALEPDVGLGRILARNAQASDVPAP
ncbi:hypothetical protein [Sulfitobacter sp. S190]|uniref:hypothetical protein n=1 Tax=Sulfitobacter sp. S190 TaxID=2867022 RepID=UPI0021A751A9|nr:hypothetical protein [Sulfitobacter sp. S190]UWR23204.1 hypothetical protein K3756_04195 [Sulfitobacter sp. S190]